MFGSHMHRDLIPNFSFPAWVDGAIVFDESVNKFENSKAEGLFGEELVVEVSDGPALGPATWVRLRANLLLAWWKQTMEEDFND